MSDLRQAALQAFEALQLWAYQEQRDAARAALHAAIAEHDRLAGIEAIEKDAGIHVSQQAEPEQEPVTTKQMLRWVEHLKRLSDDGQHMNIPGLSSGACWELAIELEQFIKNTAPTPRKPLTYDELEPLCEAFDSYDTTQNELVEFARAIERAHGIGEQHDQR